jgi:hypothetical protein
MWKWWTCNHRLNTQDTDMESVSDKEGQSSANKNQDRDSDNGTLVQLMKDNTSRIGTMHKSQTTTNSSLQSDDKQI